MNHHLRSAQVWHVFSRDFTVLPAHPHVHPQSEWAIPAFAFPAIAGIHLPIRRDGRLNRPRCEVTQAEIRTCNLPIANPALYHTATSAPSYLDICQTSYVEGIPPAKDFTTVPFTGFLRQLTVAEMTVNICFVGQHFCCVLSPAEMTVDVCFVGQHWCSVLTVTEMRVYICFALFSVQIRD